MNLLKRQPESGLLSVEVLTLLYMCVTALMIILFPLIWPGSLVSHFPGDEHVVRDMWLWRLGTLLFIVVANLIYHAAPCRATVLLRSIPLFGCLIQWYPETYAFCSTFPYQDHLFARADQWLFGFQPSEAFSRTVSSPLWSEAFHMGYYSYYYLMVAVVLFYLLRRYDEAQKATFVFLTSFFLFYFIYELLPVAGPQYYFQAIGPEAVAEGRFAPVGHYFQTHFDTLPTHATGIFSRLVTGAQEVGERPTAAFPSSHVGMSVVTMLLAWKARNRWLFWLCMPFFILLVLSTVYIKAHYAIDSIAGVFFGIGFFALASWVWPAASKLFRLKP